MPSHYKMVHFSQQSERYPSRFQMPKHIKNLVHLVLLSIKTRIKNSATEGYLKILFGCLEFQHWWISHTGPLQSSIFLELKQ